MQRLILDVDALVHARRPGLLPEIEALILALPDRAYMERSVRMEAIRSSLGRVLDEWQSAGVLHDSPTYRGLPGGGRRFQLLGRDPRWRPLSPQDRATIVLALHLGECAVLTCERLLAAAARHHGVTAIDLFDVIRFALRAARLIQARASEMCAEWDRDRFSAGRPVDYSGSFERELALREAHNPLPF